MKKEMTERVRERGGSLFRYPFKNWVVKLSKSGFYEEESGALLRARERGC